MIATATRGSDRIGGTKGYLVRLVRPDGGREIVAETDLLSEARGLPALLDATTGPRPARHESVEAATGRVVYPTNQ